MSMIELFRNAPRNGKLEDLMAYYGDVVKKTEAPYLSTTTGLQNPVYGPNVFLQVAQDFNIFSLLPKFAYQSEGFRAQTADASDFFAFGTQASAFPDSGIATLAEISVPIKEAKGKYSYSLLAQATEGKDDTVGSSFIHAYASNLYSRKINEQLGATNGTVITTENEGIDRICGSYAEKTNATQADNGAYTTDDLDLYSLNRDAAATWADASVDYATTDRTLSIDMIKDRIHAVKQYGGKPTFLLTGFDTAGDISGLVQTQERYQSADIKASVSFNGVSTEAGINAGMLVQSVYNTPVFESQHVVQETSGSSRIYGLDVSADPMGQNVKLGIKLGMPTMKISTSDYLANDASKDLFGLITLFETECHHFRSQFKIRDLL